ncbi:hypothetical protein [Massilia pseudoviolaceinigra]|uniref:hypothetical protein n=1 Tax=Massilia pseudoviolaceinigra TaxID=3057165 RepID=UPI0027968C82|nr:hypothetical protein [Massilia sp. CCM 9206]MDQ1925063.1 hypothetical protein [Massilia sp. CCM 9206]
MFPSAGLKVQVDVDYESGSAGGLRFARTYRSDRNLWEHNYSSSGYDIGKKSKPQLEVPEQGQNCIRSVGAVSGVGRCFHLMNEGLENDFVLQRGSGPVLRFGTELDRLPPENVNDRWTPVLDSANKVIAHDVYNARNDSTERYSLDGRLERIVSRTANLLSFTYVVGKDGVKLLHSVTDHFGKSMTFTYDSAGRMRTMTTPNSGVFTYAYDEASSVNGKPVGNLTSVTYPDGKKRTYWYNEPHNTADAVLPFALTGITDENCTRYATYKYDAAGKAISTKHASGVNKYQLKRPSTVSVTDPSILVTNPLGGDQTYKYTTIYGTLRVISETQPAGSGAPASSRSIGYDRYGNIDTYTDFKGVVTKYTYILDRNLESTRTEAFGTKEQRVTTTEWHPKFRLPLRVSAPKQRTTFTYYDNGALKARTEQATGDLNGTQAFASALVGLPRTVSFTYNAHWQTETITGPTAANKVTYIYEPTTGNLMSITNALGHITRFEEYNGDGQVGLVTQPNGATTRLRYYPRGWLESVTVTGGDAKLTTDYEYDGVGQLTKVSLPGGVVINQTYDAAHRLTDIADNAGNSIHYTLDLLGNRINEEIKDPNGVLVRQTGRIFDAMSRLQQMTGAAQ